MASADQKRELIAKLTDHVAARFGGTGAGAWAQAFAAYDGNSDGAITSEELATLLEDAGIGNFLTLSLWVQGVLAELDKDRTSTITLSELMLALNAAPSAPVYAQAAEAVARPDYLYPLDYTPAQAAPKAAPKAARDVAARPPARPPGLGAPALLAGFVLVALVLSRR